MLSGKDNFLTLRFFSPKFSHNPLPPTLLTRCQRWGPGQEGVRGPEGVAGSSLHLCPASAQPLPSLGGQMGAARGAGLGEDRRCEGRLLGVAPLKPKVSVRRAAGHWHGTGRGGSGRNAEWQALSDGTSVRCGSAPSEDVLPPRPPGSWPPVPP